MILSDGTIRAFIESGTIQVVPYRPEHVQPASLDVVLGGSFLVFNRHLATCIDPREPQPELMERVTPAPGEPFVLHPGEFALGTTEERVTLPAHFVARIEGKSSLGRLGLLIHATAGFVDPGWTEGQLTLELSNVAPLPIKLWPGMKIAQLSFHVLDQPAERPYGHPELGSKYQGQDGPVASLYHLNTERSPSKPCPNCGQAPAGVNANCTYCQMVRRGPCP